jgi:tetratricopeptide (TPR) repeat protein
MEHQWTLEIVVPYLERTYPREVAKLRKWVAHRGGITLPLAFFAGDHRRTERDGLMRLFYCTSSVFEHWVADLPLHQNLNASRLDFAWGLHYADLYDECLTIVERILQTRPEDVPTLACRADTLIHLDRLDEALVSADAALALEPTHAGARESRGNVLEEREDWHGLLDNCERWKVASEVRRPALRRLLLHRAIALCALDRLEESESCITAHLELFPRQSGDIAQRRAQRVRRNVRRRAGKETH